MAQLDQPIAEPKKAKGLYIFATVASIIIPLIVFTLNRIEIELVPSPQVYTLPMVNAFFNAACALSLIAALYFVKQGNIKMHTRMIYFAMLLSLLFLIGYMAYHVSTKPTGYGGEGAMKIVYYILLASHILLAGIQTPFVLFSFVFGFTGQVEKHKKLVKIAFPIWLYVSITGVICYLMLSPYYPT